jgi:signal transduction histidine kinase
VSLGVLAAGVAHEMRNPLTGISLLMDDLHDQLVAHPRERELIERSLQEIDRLENLINGLLDYAVPSKRVTLEKLPLDSVVHNTLFLVRKLCRNQDVALTVSKEEGLPLLRIDPEKLQQALLNLLLNAVQAMPEGGSLSLDVKRVGPEESILAGPGVRITVSDSGMGIASEDVPYIFDPFFSRTPSGSGLGLAIVHSIVEEHGGRISVASQPGKGATFWMDLPVTEQEPATVSAKPRTGIDGF